MLIRLFPSAFPEPTVFTEHVFLSVFPLFGTSIFICAALGVYSGHHLGNYMAWFVFAWAVIGGISHYLFPLAAGVGFQYVPGMVTAPLPVVLGVFGAYKLWGEQAGTQMRGVDT